MFLQCFRSTTKRGSVAVVLKQFLKKCVPRVCVGAVRGAMITLMWSLISSQVFLFPSLPVPSLLARAQIAHGHVDITFAGGSVAGEHGVGGRERFAESTGCAWCEPRSSRGAARVSRGRFPPGQYFARGRLPFSAGAG